MGVFTNREIEPGIGSVTDTAWTTTDQRWLHQRVPQVGDVRRMDDGRVYRVARAGGTITVGDLVVAVPNEEDIAATEFGADTSTAPIAGEGGAVGDTKVRIADDVTGVTADEYAGGYLNITDAAGEGYQYKIKSNEATGTAGTGWLVTLYDPIKVALTNASVGTMTAHWLDGVVVHTAADYGGTATQFCVGRAMIGASSGYYFWVQTWGPALVQAGAGAFVAGSPVQLAEDDNGSGQTVVSGENRIQVIGTALEATADTVWGPVFLQICP